MGSPLFLWFLAVGLPVACILLAFCLGKRYRKSLKMIGFFILGLPSLVFTFSGLVLRSYCLIADPFWPLISLLLLFLLAMYIYNRRFDIKFDHSR